MMSKNSAQVEITVLVTAHNEAQRIQPCLRAIVEQDFPIERVEILLVDDRSTDATVDRALALDIPSLRVLRVEHPPRGISARQAALDLGFREARGEIVLVTDAGGRVPREWIRELTGHLGFRDGAITGPVIFGGASAFLARFQTLDSLMALTLHRWANRHNHPTGLLGANMAVRREAYLETGGFPAIGLALAEDRALGEALCRAGWSLRYLTAPATIKPAERTLGAYLGRARRRVLNAPSAVRLMTRLMLLSNLVLAALALFGTWWMWSWLLAARWVLGMVYIGISVIQYAPVALLVWIPIYEPLLTLVAVTVQGANLIQRRWEWGGITYTHSQGRGITAAD